MSSPTPVDLSVPTAVVPGLYIGDKRLAANKDVLHSLGITHIVNVTHDVRHYFEHEPHSFTYLRCPCHDTDTADLYQYFAPACHFIRAALESGHAALIHCQQGISRSAAIATAYLIRCHSLSLRDAYVRVKSSRPMVKVNANFLKQLIRWEKECRDSEQRKQKADGESAREEREASEAEQQAEGKGTTAGPADEMGVGNKRKRVEEQSAEEAAGDKRKEVEETEEKPTAAVGEQNSAAVADSANDEHTVKEEEDVGSGKRRRVSIQPAEQLSHNVAAAGQTAVGDAHES